MSARARLEAEPVAGARAYFAVQAAAGALWWVAVFASEAVRTGTLGGWDPAIVAVPDLVLFVGASAVAAVAGNRYAAATAAVWTTAMTIALTVYGLVERVAGWGVLLMAVATVGSVAAGATVWLGRMPVEWFFVGPFAFRVASRAASASHVRRSLAQVVVFWTTFFVVVPAVVVVVERRLHLAWSALDQPLWDRLGIALFLAGSALGLWSCITMAIRGQGTPLPAQTARDLVVSGPYRVVRNPMAVAGAIQTASIGLWVGSWLVVAIGFAGALVWNAVIRPAEEADLARRFGEPYERYRATIRCWVPSRPWSNDST